MFIGMSAKFIPRKTPDFFLNALEVVKKLLEKLSQQLVPRITPDGFPGYVRGKSRIKIENPGWPRTTPEISGVFRGLHTLVNLFE